VWRELAERVRVERAAAEARERELCDDLGRIGLAWSLAAEYGEASFEVGWFGGCELGEEHLGELDFA
jgi:hypothetical protein